MDDKNTIPTKPLRNERSPEFFEAYANNVFTEVSTWDIKFIFGQLDQATGTIQQHTAITTTWQLAKLALYHLESQVLAHELFYGPIQIADDILPPEPVAPSGDFAKNPKFVEIYEAIKKLREDFVAEVKKAQS